LIQWGNCTIKSIEAVRTKLYDNTKAARALWEKIGTPVTGLARTTTVETTKPPVGSGCPTPPPDRTIGPLLDVTWGQQCSYNDLCPNINCPSNCYNTNAPTGCVATSTSQIIHYWHPIITKYTYNFTTMPVHSGNNDVQRMMRDIGTEVGMSYDCNGSGANAANVPGMLSAVFKLGSPNRHNYGTGSYQDIKNDVAQGRPVLLEGCADQSSYWIFWHQYDNCHEWVCDGFMEDNYVVCEKGVQVAAGQTLAFHMNWGWHEINFNTDYNGWYAFADWTIQDNNGTTLNFQYANSIVTNIHP
jgi:hypothetical protein